VSGGPAANPGDSTPPPYRTIGAVLLLALAACSARRLYEGPARPAEEVAVVRVKVRKPATGSPGDEAYTVRMVGVNDLDFEDHEISVEVLPGRHRIHLEWTLYRISERWWAFYTSDAELPYWERTAGGRRTMEIDVEAGKRYRLIVPWEEAGIDWYFEEFGRRPAD